MYFSDTTLPTLAENLALDEALLLEADAGRGGECLRLWDWPHYAVVVGASGALHEEVHREACDRDGVAVARRASGGGTVLLGPGCLSYALIVSMNDRPPMRQVTSSYCAIMPRIGQALQALIPHGDVHCAGSSDLAWSGRKFSGNAQRRCRRFLLHHGTLLYDFDLEKLAEYLPAPPRQPEYRAGRLHGDFVVNLPVNRSALQAALQAAWGADVPAPNLPADLVARLVNEKYATAAWIERR